MAVTVVGICHAWSNTLPTTIANFSSVISKLCAVNIGFELFYVCIKGKKREVKINCVK